VKFDEHGGMAGTTIEVVINKDHDFYKRYYLGEGSNPATRRSWELFFCAFADLFFRYEEDYQDFFKSFLNQVSLKLQSLSKKLPKEDPVDVHTKSEEESIDFDDAAALDDVLTNPDGEKKDSTNA